MVSLLAAHACAAPSAAAELRRPVVTFVLGFAANDTPAEPDLPREIRTSCEIFDMRLRDLGMRYEIRPEPPRILVRIEGRDRTRVDRVRSELTRTGRLEIRRVHPDSPGSSGRHGKPAPEPPGGYDALVLRVSHGNREDDEVYWVRRGSELPPRPVEKAATLQSSTGDYEVAVTFTDSARDGFARITRELAETNAQHPSRLAIVVDGRLFAAPTVTAPITGGRAMITGSFDYREALELANHLNSPWHAPTLLEERTE